MDGQDTWPSFFIFSKIIFSKTVTILREIVTSFCIIYRYFCTKTTNTDMRVSLKRKGNFKTIGKIA